jgi:uncharacterized protein YdeI (YjbR/CyaY-like superfamily)
MNSKVDFFFEKNSPWQQCNIALRTILLNCGLEETLKWGNPCYLYNNRNVVLVHSFRDYTALLFFKGVLLSDDSRILVQQTENVQASRQMRFVTLEQITANASTISNYVLEAKNIEAQGKKVSLKSIDDLQLPEELSAALEENQELATAFRSLSPGRQRAYALYIGKAKQTETRIARIEKYRTKILSGKGIDD